MKDFKNLYHLTRIEGLGPVRILKLLDYFGSAEKVLNASELELINVEGFSTILAKSFIKQRKIIKESLMGYEKLISELDKSQTGVITIDDSLYPKYLRKIYDSPSILFYKGEFESITSNRKLINTLSIVGTRSPSLYGKDIAKNISFELSKIGMTIVSGFARGIDTLSHIGSLNANNPDSVTVAVLGCGVDYVYPPENKKLYDKIIEKGLILSEYEPGTLPDAINFPKRNRIISGLSLGTIIVECGKDSGALITARYALDQSREVFAIPGNIHSKLSKGTNDLIKNGQAKLVTNIDDILIEVESKLVGIGKNKDSKKVDKSDIVKLNGNEKKIYDIITNTNETIDIDSISLNSELNISDCLVALLNLEFNNLIKQLPGKRFITIN